MRAMGRQVNTVEGQVLQWSQGWDLITATLRDPGHPCKRESGKATVFTRRYHVVIPGFTEAERNTVSIPWRGSK